MFGRSHDTAHAQGSVFTTAMQAASQDSFVLMFVLHPCTERLQMHHQFYLVYTCSAQENSCTRVYEASGQCTAMYVCMYKNRAPCPTTPRYLLRYLLYRT